VKAANNAGMPVIMVLAPALVVELALKESDASPTFIFPPLGAVELSLFEWQCRNPE